MAITIDMTKGVYRRLYAGMRKGKRINTVSVKAALMFWHLHTVADDFGNLHGDPSLVKSEALPCRREITAAQVVDLITELVQTKPPLIAVYQVDGEFYIHISDFEELQPGGKNGKRIRKVPPPAVNPGESRIMQVQRVESSPAHSHSDPHSHSQSPLSPPKGGQRERRLSRAEKIANDAERIAKAGAR